MTDSYGNAPNGYNKRRTKKDGVEAARKLAFGDYRFARLELTAEERDDCRAYVSNGKAAYAGIDEYLGAGYSVKFSTDRKGQGVLCSVTCQDVARGDAGLILTGRGSTAAIAWGVFLYKDLVICENRTWREAEHERGGSYQDIG